ncbi:MAG: hypothetical protein DRP25_03960, partial [Thermotoga sp.]
MKMRRSEILFLYDVKWGNPNGDPMDENKPRMDENTDTLIVSDVRLKSLTSLTIRVSVFSSILGLFSSIGSP